MEAQITACMVLSAVLSAHEKCSDTGAAQFCSITKKPLAHDIPTFISDQAAPIDNREAVKVKRTTTPKL